jgi:hypothetical protein
VQSARQLFKRYVSILKEIGFVQIIAEPCLLTKSSEKGIVMMEIHVNNYFVVGHTAAIYETIELINRSGLELKVEKNFTDYLGCEIFFNDNKTKAWIGQQTVVSKIEKNFGDLVIGIGLVKTPVTANFNVIQPKNDNDKISKDYQKVYRSGVGSLLNLVKHSRSDISNAVCELAKGMAGGTPAAFKELQRVLKFVLQTRSYGLYVEPEGDPMKKWEMLIYTDSDWAGDKDSRKSVTGYILYLMNVPILWKSRLQKTVALSSTEAEYSHSAKQPRKSNSFYRYWNPSG